MENIHKGKILSAILNVIYIVLHKYKEIPTTIRERKYRKKDAYIEFEPPEEIGWQGEKFQRYINDAWEKVKNSIAEKEDIFVHAYRGIVRGIEKDQISLDVLKFQKQYWDEVETILPGEKKTVGVHIRRTDHKVAIKNSSIETFISIMQKILDAEPDTVFFLSTDDSLVEKRLREQYTDRIITQKKKEWGRDSKAAMKSGIIDCLCLSKCNYILGSYTSAFSEFAAKYGHKKLIICRDVAND